MNRDHHHDAGRSPSTSAQAVVQTGVVVAFPDRRAVTVEFGSGWYHDAAIKDAAPVPARPQ